MSFKLNFVFTLKRPSRVEKVTSLSAGVRASVSLEKPSRKLPPPQAAEQGIPLRQFVTDAVAEKLRVESGLTYGARSRFDSRKVPGPFLITSFTKTETTVQALDMALDVLASLHKNGLTKEQLDSAKSYIKGQFPPNIETSAQLAGIVARDEFLGLDDSEINSLEARVDAVTPEIARQVIQKHYPLDNLVFTLIGKASEIRPAIQKYAPKVDERPISEPGFWPPPAQK